MRRVAISAVLIAAMAMPAYAQFSMGNSGGEPRERTRYTAAEKKKEAEVEQAYKDAVKNTRNSSSETYDPWRTIRPAGNNEIKQKPSR